MVILVLACASSPTTDTSTDTDADADADTDADTDADSDTDSDTDTDTDTDSDTDTDTSDGDADGHASESVGGDDCDDTNALVYPGAFEYCDTVDQDCDGDAIGYACGEEIPAAAAGIEVVDAPERYAYVGLVPDLTGDGVDDMIRMRAVEMDLIIYEGGPPYETYGEELTGTWHDVDF